MRAMPLSISKSRPLILPRAVHCLRVLAYIPARRKPPRTARRTSRAQTAQRGAPRRGRQEGAVGECRDDREDQIGRRAVDGLTKLARVAYPLGEESPAATPLNALIGSDSARPTSAASVHSARVPILDWRRARERRRFDDVKATAHHPPASSARLRRSPLRERPLDHRSHERDGPRTEPGGNDSPEDRVAQVRRFSFPKARPARASAHQSALAGGRGRT